MNKSLEIRNKIFRFCFLLSSFLLLVYLFHFLINGKKGLLEYYRSLIKLSVLEEDFAQLKERNTKLESKISRLSPNNIDLDYLDEQIRISTGKSLPNELVINLNK